MTTEHKPHSDPFDEGGQVTHQHSDQHSGAFGFEDIATGEKRTFDTLDELSDFLRMRAADQAYDAWQLVSEPVTEDSLICMKPSHRRLEEQLESAQAHGAQAEAFIAHMDMGYRWVEWLERASIPAKRPT